MTFMTWEVQSWPRNQPQVPTSHALCTVTPLVRRRRPLSSEHPDSQELLFMHPPPPPEGYPPLTPARVLPVPCSTSSFYGRCLMNPSGVCLVHNIISVLITGNVIKLPPKAS